MLPTRCGPPVRSFEMEQREALDITSTVPLTTPEYAEPVDQG